MLPPPVPLPQVIELHEAHREAARQRAYFAAAELGCAAGTLGTIDHPSDQDLFFTCANGPQRYVLKTHMGDAAALTSWREPLHTQLAARAGVGAATRQLRTVSGVVATAFVAGDAPDAAGLRRVDLEVVSQLHTLHRAIDAAAAAGATSRSRADLFAGVLGALARPRVGELLGDAGVASFRERLFWLQAELVPLPYTPTFIHGDVHPGNVIMQGGRPMLIDWGNARIDDPYLDYVRMSFTLRTPNSRLLAYIARDAACRGDTVTAAQSRRALLLQAVYNLRWYLTWLDDGGPAHVQSVGMVPRLLDDAAGLPNLPPVHLPAPHRTLAGAPQQAQDLNQARALAHDFVAAVLPEGVALTEPIPEHKAEFAYFRARGAGQDWFIKVRYGKPADAAWAEPAWMAWAAAEGLGPAVQPWSGQGQFAHVLASAWIDGGNLTPRTANAPEAHQAVLKKLRQVHQTPPPAHLMGTAPEAAPDYAGGAWGRLDELDAANTQRPLTTAWLRQLLNRAIAELSAEPAPQGVCHRDALPRNMFVQNGQAELIDWDWAGWDDPLRDVARFFALAYTPIKDLHDSLAIYLGRPATQAELRRMYSYTLTTEIDFYGANQADYGPEHKAVTMKAERIEQLAALLGFQ